MYHLHFHEGTQEFIIIESGSTITPAKHGIDVLSSISTDKLMMVAMTAKLIAKEFGLKYTVDHLKELFNKFQTATPIKNAE